MNIKITSIVSLFILFWVSCDSPIESTPESATISGTITFTNTDSWPTEGDVTVSLSSDWPPSGAPAAYAVITSSNLTSDSYNYEFTAVPFGTYSIAVAWENPDETYNSTCNKSILGAIGGEYPFTTIGSLTTNTTNYNVTDNDFNASFSYAVPNSYNQCYPICATLEIEASCTANYHCTWMTHDETNYMCMSKSQ